tara:strand:- start:28915 stop:29379 length:465 start_codon:yes stop_codon:yes gene_type:complete
MSKPLVASSNPVFPPVATLVPHAAPMLLIDRILSANDDGMTAEVTIGLDSLFYHHETGVPGYVGIEYIAQTVSAYSGWRARKTSPENGEKPKIGYLLGTRKMTITSDGFQLGDRLEIAILNIFEDGEMAVFDGTVCCNQQVIVSARVNVYQPNT